MVRGVSPDSSTISTSPDLIDVEREVAVAGLEELLAVAVPPERRQGASPQRGHLRLVELGESGGVQVLLGHLSASSRLGPCGSPQVGLEFLRHVNLDLIDVAPGPALAGLEGRGDRVLRRVGVARRVAARRAVATADVAAAQAEPQVDPGRAEPQALLAPIRGPGWDRFETFLMFADHRSSP